MNRVLAAFRAVPDPDAKTRFAAAYGRDNPEKGENPAPASADPRWERVFAVFGIVGAIRVEKPRILPPPMSAAEALGVPDPEVARERAEIASALAAEATGAFGPTHRHRTNTRTPWRASCAALRRTRAHLGRRKRRRERRG